MLGIEFPVMLAGMGGVSYHELVAAVSEAGGIGTLGASTMRDHELPEEMRKVRELTKKPFGVDLLTALPNQVDSGIKAVIEGGASIFVAGLGVPREVIDLLHQKNILVGSMCGKVKHAVAAVASGCDFVVAQGTEAGGHTGLVATIALVPQVVDAVGDKVHVQFRRNGLKSSTVIERDSAQRFNCVIDWMEKQAEAATHATQHNDVVVVRHQIRGPNTMRRTNVAAKMWFNNVLARV
jgi:hypothetical protein